MQTNINGTQVLMHAVNMAQSTTTRFLQMKFRVTCHWIAPLFFTKETPSPYSSSKDAADLLVNAYHRTFGLPSTISRGTNNYGLYLIPEKLIPLMSANALAKKPLPVYGEGLNVRDWLDVEDHCKAKDLIIRKGKIGEVYNIGGHNEMKNIYIVKIICTGLEIVFVQDNQFIAGGTE